MKNKAFTNKCANLLKSKHNIILQGAPGTGKTYNTAAIALSVLGIDGVNLDNHDEVMKKYEELQDDRIFFTTFHQSLDYEDFVEGLKPRVQTNENGESLGVTYEPEDGIFKRACNAVVTDDSKDIIEFVLLLLTVLFPSFHHTYNDDFPVTVGISRRFSNPFIFCR